MTVWQPCRTTLQKGIRFYTSLCFHGRATVDRIADVALDVVTRPTPHIDGMITSLAHWRRHDQLIHRSALVSYQATCGQCDVTDGSRASSKLSCLCGQRLCSLL